MSVMRFAAQLALGVALTAWVLRRDLRGRSARELSRSWNDASLWTAVVVFGPFCLLVHYVKTRRSFSGLLLGLFWTALLLLGLSLIDYVLGLFDPLLLE